MSGSSAGVPRMATRGHGLVLGAWLLLFVLCHVLSPVYCLSPPILSLLFQLLHLCLPHYPPRLSPYLFSRCLQSYVDLLFYVDLCVMFACTTVLCLPVFPPQGGFCSFLFHFIIKRKTILSATWILASTPLTHCDILLVYNYNSALK